jgi:hypothetical protein
MAGSFSPSHHPTCAPVARPAAERRKGAPVSSLPTFSARRCTRRERNTTSRVLLIPWQRNGPRHAPAFPGRWPRSLARAYSMPLPLRCLPSRAAPHTCPAPYPYYYYSSARDHLPGCLCLCWGSAGAWANSSLARPDVARGHGGRVSLHKTAMDTHTKRKCRE